MIDCWYSLIEIDFQKINEGTIISLLIGMNRRKDFPSTVFVN
ncbi:hypothetical protein BN1088_1432342 [Sphingobacterium sp. PM2-P1-29]|nr:hypothetical protein BN1088_1432342 [Sphingobacterium sp. PM2-P1-29]